MLCCLLIALLGTPFLLWGKAGTSKQHGRDCCANGRGAVLMVPVLMVVALCSTILILGWLAPTPFRHICSVFVRP
jgi:hypothetical protein